ncbi:MAG: hypothetical protein JXM70_02135 [Pirellulales bacterium]|nr:hypothetical protein [Pirellulales bacterium]
MRYFFGTLCVSLLLCNFTSANSLMLVGTDVQWNPNTEPSPTSYVEIYNDTGTTDRLAGWQLKMKIEPLSGATGILQFNSADYPREPIEKYLLEGDSSYILVTPPPAVAGPTDTVLIQDYALSGYGSEVPTTLHTLVKLDYHASADAEGIFAVTAVRGLANSLWATLDSQDSERGFTNVPQGEGADVAIWYVTVQVPEPGCFLYLSCLMVCLVFTQASRIRVNR